MVTSDFIRWTIKKGEEGFNERILVVEYRTGRVVASFEKKTGDRIMGSLRNMVRLHNQGKGEKIG